MSDFKYDDSSELERYLSGAMSPEEAHAFTLRVEHDRDLHSMVEADRMIRRVVDGDLRSLPSSPADSRARIAQTARSAPRYAPPIAATARKSAGAKKWIATIIGLGIMITVGVVVERGTENPRSAVDAAAHGDTLERTDTAARRAQPATSETSSHETHTATAPRREAPAVNAPDGAAQTATGTVSSGAHATSTGSAPTASSGNHARVADTATRSIQNDSAHAPLTISPVRINRPATSSGTP